MKPNKNRKQINVFKSLYSKGIDIKTKKESYYSIYHVLYEQVKTKDIDRFIKECREEGKKQSDIEELVKKEIGQVIDFSSEDIINVASKVYHKICQYKNKGALQVVVTNGCWDLQSHDSYYKLTHTEERTLHLAIAKFKEGK